MSLDDTKVRLELSYIGMYSSFLLSFRLYYYDIFTLLGYWTCLWMTLKFDHHRCAMSSSGLPTIGLVENWCGTTSGDTTPVWLPSKCYSPSP